MSANDAEGWALTRPMTRPMDAALYREIHRAAIALVAYREACRTNPTQGADRD